MADSRSIIPTSSTDGSTDQPARDNQNIEKLLDEIYEIGEQVKRNPGRECVLLYKGAVQQLITIALGSLRVEEQTSSPNILRQKRYTIVRVIDQKLDRLVSEVLMSQRDTMNILGRIDEINGLLVDLAR